MKQVLARIRLLSVYIVLLLPVIVYGAVHALQSSNNSPIDWVDSSFSERRHYDEFVELFGPGDTVIASWPGCVRTDQRLDKLVRILRESKTFRTADGEPLIHQVVSGRETLLEMIGEKATASDESAAAETTESDAVVSEPVEKRPRFTPELALQRLQGILIGKDGLTTCIIITLNRAGLIQRATVVEDIRRAIRVCCKVPDNRIHLAGPVIDGFTVDQASHRSLTRFAGPSSVLIFLICWWSLGSLLSGAVVFLTAAFCQAALLAVIFYTGQTLSALLIILPPLVQVLTVSGGIHLMNYYHNALEYLPPREAAIDAFRKGWLPSMLSLGTTAMGTASLMVSGLEPIRLFGIYGTVGVLMTTAAVLTVVPCSMILFGRKHSIRNTYGDHPTTEAPTAPIIESRTDRAWKRLTLLLNNRNSIALVMLLGLMLAGGAGLPGLQTSIRIETLFPDDSRIMQDYVWLEEHLGPLVPIDVLVRFENTAALSDRERMDVLWRIDDSLGKQPHVQSTVSALTFLPPMPPLKSVPVSMRAAVLNNIIHQARPGFERLAMLRHTADAEVWRMTAHVSSTETLDYGEVLNDVRTSIQSELQNAGDLDTSGIAISTSGIMPLVHQIQGQLLSDLFSSLMSALLVITVTMTVVEAGLISGVLAMASNIFPIVIAFGCMGWTRIPMDIGSVMTASVALGIAVDDTLHFLAFFRRMMNQPGATRSSAVLSAYQHCGVAMIQTSVSCGLGLLVFSFSDFVPTSRFAILMAILLLLALLGDLLLLPALLLSSAGRFFTRHLSENQHETGVNPNGE